MVLRVATTHDTQHPQQQPDKKTRHGRMGVKDPHGPAGCLRKRELKKVFLTWYKLSAAILSFSTILSFAKQRPIFFQTMIIRRKIPRRFELISIVQLNM